MPLAPPQMARDTLRGSFTFLLSKKYFAGTAYGKLEDHAYFLYEVRYLLYHRPELQGKISFINS